MDATGGNRRRWAGAIWASIVAAGAFEALTVLATQDKSIWAATPWKDDPYHTAVSVAQFTVPMLALVILLRLLVRRAPAAPDRGRQMLRAATAMTALVGLTSACEWAAVVAGANASATDAWTGVMVIGLAVTSALAVVAAGSLWRCRRQRGRSDRRDDWLDDAVFCCRRLPVLRRWVSPASANRMRRHAMSVFVAVSVLAAAAITAAQAVGERMTDPLLIGWLLLVETGANLAFCVISNAVAGFIARPPRTRVRRVAESAVVAGCVATVVAVGFHDALWGAVAAGPLRPTGLAVLTLGFGLATSLVTAAVLVAGSGMPATGRRPRDH